MPPTSLTLLHTNDLHGSVAGLSRAASLARSIRAECAATGRPCLWWDAGDVEEWTVLESAASNGAALWALLAAAGVDQATVGNGLLLTYGSRALPGAAAAFGKPVLLAGLTELETGRPSPATIPYALYDLDGLTLGVIGITVAIKEYRYLGFEVDDPARVLERWLPEVRAAGADVVAVLSHCGSGRDQELARRFGPRNIGWIVSAHDHAVYDEPLEVGGVYIVETGHRGGHLGRLDLELAPGRVLSARGSLLPLRDGPPPDPAVEQAWIAQQELRATGLDEVLAVLAGPAPLSYDEESPMANLLADAMCEVVGAEVAVVIPGHLRGGFSGGPVTRGDLLRILASATHPACARLTGEQIAALLELRIDPGRMGQKPLPLRGKPFGFPALSGLRAELDLAAPTGRRVRGLRLASGAPLHPRRLYTVASSYYELHFGFLDLLGPPTPPDLELVGGPLGATLSAYLARHSPLAPPPVGRVALA